MDPLSDVLAALHARSTRRTRFEGSGAWALTFPALERLKFVAILRGASWLLRPDLEPQRLVAGDCCLIGKTPYTFASDPALLPIAGASLFADGNDVVHWGGDETVAIGGGLAFAPGCASFLLDMLPPFLHVPANSPGATSITSVLGLLDAESEDQLLGNDVVTARLSDVLMIQAIRTIAACGSVSGWLGALADPRIGRAIRAFHDEVARPWTVAELAAEAGMSRASFSAAFTRRVRQAPVAYMRAWRMTRARAALAEGHSNVGQLAAAAGYKSQSAFGHAYRQTFGVAPRRKSAGSGSKARRSFI
jgi:AraC-like DNA-binding protein